MFLAYLSLVFIAVLTYGAYKLYFKPRRQYYRYKKMLEDLGYRVYMRKFKFCGISKIEDVKQGVEKHNDALYLQKTAFTNYDVTISCLGNTICVSFIKPELLKQFFSPEIIYAFPKMESAILGMKEGSQNSLLFSEGKYWKEKRKTLSKLFSFDLLVQNIPKICQILNKNIAEFEQNSKISQNTFSYDLADFGGNVFNRLMMKCFMGTEQIKQKINDISYERYLMDLIVELYKISFTPLPFILGKIAFTLGLSKGIRILKNKIAVFQALSLEIINKRIRQVKKQIQQGKEQKCTDIIQALIIQQHKSKAVNGQNDYQLSYKDLVQQFMTFVAVGTDTSTHYLQMMIYLICQNPQIEERLRHDIDEVIKSDADITLPNLKKLVYIDWIQSETLRYYGPVNGIFIRKAAMDCFVGNIPISKGTAVGIQILGNHYNGQIFKDPYVFRPQRWESQCDHVHPFAMIGFSAGPRTCLGKHLSLIESKIALVKLFKRYKQIIPPKGPRVMQLDVLYHPKKAKTTFILAQP